MTDDDIWNVLKHGRLFRIDEPMGFTRYHIRGRSIHGDAVVCPVEIDDEGDWLIIVTAFQEKFPG